VVEGQGKATIGAESFEFGPRDVFVAPSWMPVRFDARAECVLFSFSDRPAQEAIGLWRERRD
jgi:gentisate 1,2-dioxygenase